VVLSFQKFGVFPNEEIDMSNRKKTRTVRWGWLVWLYPAGWVAGVVGIVVAGQLGLLKDVDRCERVGEVKFGFMLQARPIPVRCTANHYWSWVPSH
jgi:hypothetical protein